MEKLPTFSVELIRALDASHPARCIRAGESLELHQRYAGARDLIDSLLARLRVAEAHASDPTQPLLETLGVLRQTPKMNTAAPPVEYMHNQYLDGTTDGTGQMKGRNSLVVDMGAPTGSGLNTNGQAPAPAAMAQVRPTSGAQLSVGMAGANNFSMTPGMVVPTIGGALAGTVPGAVAK